MPTFWHYKVLTIISVDQCTSFFLCLQSAKFYGFSEFSLKSWICWRFATLLYTNCPGRPPETGNTLAITYHVHVPHAHWTSLGLTATATAVAWTVTEVRTWWLGWYFCGDFWDLMNVKMSRLANNVMKSVIRVLFLGVGIYSPRMGHFDEWKLVPMTFEHWILVFFAWHFL